MDNKLKLINSMFQGSTIRTACINEDEYYLSIIDVIAVLTDKEYNTARNYWKVLKKRLNKEESEVVTKCNQLKLQSSDGKFYATDTFNIEDTLRIIESIPSPKAEPFKMWLANLGDERIDEMQAPEKTLERAIEYMLHNGFNEQTILNTINNVIYKADIKLINQALNDIIEVKDTKIETIKNLFRDHVIRSVWSPEEEEFYFSVVDIISAITDSPNPRHYWAVLKSRLKQEGSQVTTNCNQLKMEAPDGKMRNRDVLKTSDIFRLIESIPHKNAEPFKIWLANLGRKRIDEIYDPTIAIRNAIDNYHRRGFSDEWIKRRVSGILTRHSVVGGWKNHGIKDDWEISVLTNEIYKEIFDKTARELKENKGLQKESLRDNMTATEQALVFLGEAATKELMDEHNPFGLEENKVIARQGGNVSRVAKETLEEKLGRSISTKSDKSIATLPDGKNNSSGDKS